MAKKRKSTTKKTRKRNTNKVKMRRKPCVSRITRK